jgi:small basic protein
MLIISVILGVILGALLGIVAPTIPYVYARYTAVAIVAALDSVIGGVAAASQDKFDLKIFVSGFFANSFLAIILTMLGESLDVDIFLAAIFVFVYRIFNNLSIIRRFIIDDISKKITRKKEIKNEK